ncbi:MAG: V-type ATP synthase subunit D, partial [Thermoplasmata archaeon]
MAKYEVAPTKTNLLRLKSEYELAKEGYELLDQKRNILLLELMGLVDTAERMEIELKNLLIEAYNALQEAVKTNGRIKLYFISNSINISHNIHTSTRKVMGVTLPVLDVSFSDNPPYYSLVETTFWVDEAVRLFKKVLELISKLAQVRISLLRLANETKKTIRKVNALEKIAIPDYIETIKFLEDRFE